MARRRVPKAALTPDQKKKQRQLRRELRKSSALGDDVKVSSKKPERTEHQDAQFWLLTRDRMSASKILNDHRERPWWLSVPGTGSSPPHISGFFPCSMFRRGDRWFYGFLFRHHRDTMFKKTSGARKELTE